MRLMTPGLVLWLFAGALHAQPPPPALESLLEAGKDAMYRLRYAEARRLFGQIVETYPESPVGYGMLSIEALNELIMAASNPVLQPYGAPDPYSKLRIFEPIDAETESFHRATERLISVTDSILDRDPEDAEALYFRGLAEENRAAEALVISSDKMSALGPGRRAKGIHDEVLELDPAFVDAKVSLAGYEYALATVDGLAGMVLAPIQFFGFFRGDKEKAFAMLDEVGREGRYRALEARVLLSIMNAAHGDPHVSVEILRSLQTEYPESYLIDLNLAAMLERKLGDPESALAVYESLLGSLPSKTPGLGEAEVHFLIGKTRLGMGNWVGARAAFDAVLRTSAREAETQPLAWFYLARIDEERGEAASAAGFYRQFVSLAGQMESLEDEVEAAEKKLR